MNPDLRTILHNVIDSVNVSVRKTSKATNVTNVNPVILILTETMNSVVLPVSAMDIQPHAHPLQVILNKKLNPVSIVIQNDGSPKIKTE